MANTIYQRSVTLSHNFNVKQKKEYKELITTKFDGKFENDDFLFENFIRIISKPPSNRSQKELNIIVHFLEMTELKPNNENEFLIRKVLFFCAMTIELVVFNNSEIICFEGDPADCFFINFQGSLKVFKSNEISNYLNSEEYLEILNSLYVKGFIDSFKKTISDNKSIFFIPDDNPQFVRILIFLCKLVKLSTLSKNITDYVVLCKKHNINSEELNIDLNLLCHKDQDHTYLINKVNYILKYFSPNHETRYFNYIYDEDKKLVKITEKVFLVKLSKNKIFGDFALEKNKGIRTATIQCDELCYIGKIPKDLYVNYILAEKQKQKTQNVNFLIESFFLKKLKFHYFEKRYFLDFGLEEYSKGCILNEIKDSEQYIYIIKEGEVELKLESNILQLSKLIHLILNSCKFKNSENYLSFENEIHDNLIKKRSYRILLYGQKSVIGVESLFLNIPIFYTINVFSEKAKIFRINTKKLLSLLHHEPQCQEDYTNYAKQRISLILNRLIEIKNTDFRIKKMNEIKNVTETNPTTERKNAASFSNVLLISKQPSKTSFIKNTENEKKINKELVLHSRRSVCMSYDWEKARDNEIKKSINEEGVSRNYRNNVRKKKITLEEIISKEEKFNELMISSERTDNYTRFDVESIFRLPKISLVNFSDQVKTQNSLTTLQKKLNNISNLKKNGKKTKVFKILKIPKKSQNDQK